MKNDHPLLNAEMWTAFNRSMERQFDGFNATKRQYADFVDYCLNGAGSNGVTPVFNFINLYAFCHKISTEEARDKMRVWNET